MSKRVSLFEIAYARSGDKGNNSNIGVIAKTDRYYQLLLKYLTAEKVKKHFSHVCYGKVERYELPNIGALNFVLEDSLDGGGTVSLRTDAQGKAYGALILKMQLELEEKEWNEIS